jgi:hypothetical protein
MERKSMCWLSLQRMLTQIASTLPGVLRWIGENEGFCGLVGPYLPPSFYFGRSFLRMWRVLNLGGDSLLHWVALSITISGLTEDRKCRNSSSLDFVKPLAFHCRHLKSEIVGLVIVVGRLVHDFMVDEFKIGRGSCKGEGAA